MIHLVHKMDEQRRKYYEHYTGLPWGDPSHYDLFIDSGRTGIEPAVEQIAQRYESLPSR